MKSCFLNNNNKVDRCSFSSAARKINKWGADIDVLAEEIQQMSEACAFHSFPLDSTIFDSVIAEG